MGKLEQKRALTVEEALHLRTLPMRSHVELSPDGEWASYTIADPFKRQSPTDTLYSIYSPEGVSFDVGGCSAWITHVSSGDSICLSSSESTSWSPSWSPDSRHVAFFSTENGKAQLWIWNRETRTRQCMSERIVRSFFALERPRWSPDGKKILFKALPDGVSIDQANAWSAQDSSAMSSSNETVDVIRMHEGDLVVVNLDDRKVSVVARYIITSWYEFSPVDPLIAFIEVTGRTDTSAPTYMKRLCVGSLDTFQTTVIAKDLSFGDAIAIASWSPDGCSIAYALNRPAKDHGCHIVDVNSGKHIAIPTPDGVFFGNDYRPPLWFTDCQRLLLFHSNKLGIVDVETQSVNVCATVPAKAIWDIVGSNKGRAFWSPDQEQSAFIVGFDASEQRNCLWQVNLNNGTTQPIKELSGELDIVAAFNIDTSADQRRLLYKRERVDQPADLWITDNLLKQTRQVTHLNPGREDVRFGNSRIVEWVAPDGKALKGILLLPAPREQGKRYPLIVSVYPANRSHYVNRYGLEGNPRHVIADLHLLTSRGYAVFVPDVPAEGQSKMKQIVDYVHSGVDQVIKDDFADPNRLGVIGHSDGGYSALCLVANSPRWRAAVAVSSYSDLVALASVASDGTCYSMTNTEGSLGVSLWENRQIYLDHSPFYLMDRVETPVLLIQGAEDITTPPHLAEQTLSALKYHGKVVSYTRYEGEGHSPRYWSYENQLDFNNRVLAWFEKYV